MGSYIDAQKAEIEHLRQRNAEMQALMGKSDDNPLPGNLPPVGVTPAATAQLISKSFRGSLLWTQGFGLTSTFLGLYLSAELNTGSGSMIALVAAMLFATVGLLKLLSSQLPAYGASPESEETQG